VSDRVKPSFVIFDIQALWRSALPCIHTTTLKLCAYQSHRKSQTKPSFSAVAPASSNICDGNELIKSSNGMSLSCFRASSSAEWSSYRLHTMSNHLHHHNPGFHCNLTGSQFHNGIANMTSCVAITQWHEATCCLWLWQSNIKVHDTCPRNRRHKSTPFLLTTFFGASFRSMCVCLERKFLAPRINNGWKY